jgi:hypothetical protein
MAEAESNGLAPATAEKSILSSTGGRKVSPDPAARAKAVLEERKRESVRFNCKALSFEGFVRFL